MAKHINAVLIKNLPNYPRMICTELTMLIIKPTLLGVRLQRHDGLTVYTVFYEDQC